MKIRKFRAVNSQQAVSLVRREMGPQAIILDTRRVREGGFLGLFGRNLVEVTAAVDDEPGPQPPPVEQARSRETEILQGLERQIKEMRLSLERVARAPAAGDLPGEVGQMQRRLVEVGIEPDRARQLLESLRPEPGVVTNLSLGEEVRRAIVEHLGPPSPITVNGEKKLIAFVGPTGVGKTTTIAKLAADFSLGKSRKVALLTVDTYRIAAVEQLRTYGDIMGIPVKVAYSPGELRELKKNTEAEVILLDTAGRSHRNSMHMGELKTFLDACSPDEVHLVLNAAVGDREGREILEAYSDTGLTQLLFTKLDEGVVFGNIYNLREKTGLPLSYITDGQNVPDDIAVADPDRLADLILGGSEGDG